MSDKLRSFPLTVTAVNRPTAEESVVGTDALHASFHAGALLVLNFLVKQNRMDPRTAKHISNDIRDRFTVAVGEPGEYLPVEHDGTTTTATEALAAAQQVLRALTEPPFGLYHMTEQGVTKLTA